MFDPVTLLLSQGPLGLVAGIFVWLYLSERKRANEQKETYTKELDQVRQHQIQREQEIAQTLESYGKSVVEAVDRCTFLAEELRRVNDEHRR